LAPLIPVKTADGQTELSHRQRRLGQRHRTVLLLVDGRRSEQEVRSLAQRAGAGDSCFGELLALGLIALAPSGDRLATLPLAASAPGDDTPWHIDIPLVDEAPGPPAAIARARAPLPSHDEERLLPAAPALPPESMLSGAVPLHASPAGEPLEDFETLEAARSEDAPLEEARDILMRALRKEAPLAGTVTMLRLRRARSRRELAELIDEVEARIVKPHRSLAAQQLLRRARHLLETRIDPLPAR
jgi:hypothetical protein